MAPMRMTGAQSAVPASGKHGAGDAADEQREQDGRQAEDDVADPHDERVDPAAEIAGDEAEQDADASPRP